jgi:hypothetical protein
MERHTIKGIGALTAGIIGAVSSYCKGQPSPVLTEPVLPRASKPAVSRNDLCPCGSGKKYKRCCMAQYRGSASGPYLQHLR